MRRVQRPYRAEGDHGGTGHKQGIDEQGHVQSDGRSPINEHLVERAANDYVQCQYLRTAWAAQCALLHLP